MAAASVARTARAAWTGVIAGRWARWAAPPAAVVLVAVVVVVPTARHGWPTTAGGFAFVVALAASGLVLGGWRHFPRLVVLAGGALWLGASFLAGYGYFPDPALVIMALLAAVAALAFRGRAAWVVAGGMAIYLYVLWLALHASPVALAMFSVPAFFAGTVLRLRQEAADELAQRGRELAEERELFADLSMRQERARIAAELHDIVGHAISVMIIQAAAGQRLVDRDPALARQAFGAIAESARQGREDLQRLVDLLGGTEIRGPDLSLIDEVVTRAARSGLNVSCRFEGDRDGVAAPAAHIAFRVVQESLTNALRYAPGAAVRVRVDGAGRGLRIAVENDAGTGHEPELPDGAHGWRGGRGLTGLRERVQQRGGQFTAGPRPGGGWRVEATMPG